MLVEQRSFNSFISEVCAVVVEFSQPSHSDHLLFVMKRISGIINTQTGEMTAPVRALSNLYKKKLIQHPRKHCLLGFRVGGAAVAESSLTPA